MKRMLAFLLCGVIGTGFLAGCSDSPQAVQTAVVPLEEVIRSTPKSPAFQAGETVLTLNESTVNDLVEAGAAFASDSLVQTIDFSEDPLYQRAMKFKVGGTTLTIQAKNMADAISPIKSSVIKSIYFDGPSVCGIGGVAVGDSVEQVEDKLGKPDMIINAEEYRVASGGASMPSNARIYCYTSQFDDYSVRVCIDRNTSQAVLIEETSPVNLITEPRQVDDEQIRALIKAHDAGRSSVAGGQLIDTEEPGNVSGTLESIDYNRIKVLTLDEIHDARQFYINRNSIYDKAVAATYLVVEYSAVLVRNADTPLETRTDVVGCFYVPDAWITDEGEIACGVPNLSWKDSAGVFLSEENMIRSLFPDADQGYAVTDFTAMERTFQ